MLTSITTNFLKMIRKNKNTGIETSHVYRNLKCFTALGVTLFQLPCMFIIHDINNIFYGFKYNFEKVCFQDFSSVINISGK